jgi:hypothetical protein
MKVVLNFLAERAWTDQAGIQLGILEHTERLAVGLRSQSGFLHQARTAVTPPGIGTVVRVGRNNSLIFRREDALADKQRYLTFVRTGVGR